MKERYLLEEEVGENGFSLITDYDGNDEHVFDVNIKSGDILPVLPLRNMVLFPGVFLPITVGRKASLKLVREAEKKHSVSKSCSYGRPQTGRFAQCRHCRTNCTGTGNA